MTKTRLTWLSKLLLCLVATVSFLSGDSSLLAQETESSGPRTDILQMNGSKPSLSPTGEGISYYKIGDLYQRGTTQVKLIDEKLKPALPIAYMLKDLVIEKTKPELPIGYTLFNNLAYLVETTAVFTGPCDIEFVLPSVLTKESFDNLRILYAEFDRADPEKPKWIDITLDESMFDRSKGWMSPASIKTRLPNFKTRTIHAYTTEEPKFMVVALRDTSKTREMFTADLSLSGTASAQVIEGRTFTTKLKVTNQGPATATGIVLNIDEAREYLSATPTQGACRQSAQSVFCTFPSLEPNKSIEIKIVEKCPWFARDSSTTEDTTRRMILGKQITVQATERDPLLNNNQLELGTQVFPDSNKGPLVKAIGPEQFEVFPGPNANVPLRVKASDPDGVVSKVEFFEEGQLIGTASLVAENEYELLYRKPSFGTHITYVKVTDNLGRDANERMPDYFVNGVAKVEITNPKTGSKLLRDDGDIAVTIHATHPSKALKKVSLNSWGTDATPLGNDDYLVKLKFCGRKCRLEAVATDEDGVETISESVVFVVAETVLAEVRWFDGEFFQDFDTQTEFKVNELVLAPNVQHKTDSSPDAKFLKFEYYVNSNLICTTGEPQGGGHFVPSDGCTWKVPSSGQYKLQLVATDEDGMVGRSKVVEVTIQKP